MISVKLFPAIENVFVDNYDQNSKHFLPIATINLTSIDKLLNGNIHLVYYNNDPYCEDALKNCNNFCDDYKASFDIIDNKYRFKADFGFFKTNDDWNEYLDKGKKSYKENFKKYIEENFFDISEVIKNLGGEPEWRQGDEWPIDQEGNKLLFICQVWSNDFVQDYCAEEIFLFYDKQNEIAVQIHQIS